MARALHDGVHAATGTGAPALEGGPLVGERLDDHQAVGIVDAMVGLGVGGGRAEHELDVRGRSARREQEDRARLSDALAANVHQHDAGLAGRHAERVRGCAHLERGCSRGSH